MKKLLGIVVLGLLLAGCSTNIDGGKTIGMKGSDAWLAWAPYQDLVKYYSQYDVDEICVAWNYEKDSFESRRTKNRNAMKEVLKNKGQDPYLCMKLPNT